VKSKYKWQGDYHWKNYAKEGVNLYREHVEFILDIIGPEPVSVLDVGAGDGLLAAKMIDRGHHVTALDHDPLACRLADQHGIAVECRAADDLPPGRWDVALLSEVIEHVPDALGLLRELRERSGRLVLSTPPPGHRDRAAIIQYDWPALRSLLWEAGWSGRVRVKRDHSLWVEAFPYTWTIYTACFGGEMPTVPPGVPCRLVCWSDRLHGIDLERWDVRFTKPDAQLGPRLQNRFYKILGAELIEGPSIYCDGRVDLTAKILELADAAGDFGIARHPEVNCLYRELDLQRKCKKQSFETIERLRQRYTAQHIPPDCGVYQANVLIRRPDEWVKRFCRDWWREVLLTGTERDQPALAALSYRARVNDEPCPVSININAWANDFWKVRGRVGVWNWG
jgi:SAM-dependent methyltransferase